MGIFKDLYFTPIHYETFYTLSHEHLKTDRKTCQNDKKHCCTKYQTFQKDKDMENLEQREISLVLTST